MSQWIQAVSSFLSVHLGFTSLVAATLAALLTAAVWLCFHRYPTRSAHMTKMLRLWAGRAPLYLLIVLAPLALRFALLPWVPVPSPHVHDEFGHLLVSETLAAGRLANPTHPLYRHFETLYILQKPVYASTYPLGQGILLSTGKALFGHPWGGVLLGVSLMSLAIGWMLLACVPPLWAAAGAAIASIH